LYSIATNQVELTFELRNDSQVMLGIVDVTGRQIRVFDECDLAKGFHTVSWDGTDEGRRQVLPGVYFARLETERRTQTQTIVRTD